ncbi:MAG: hypothetical protein U1E66_04690 [Rhodospirillales bacterium]
MSAWVLACFALFVLVHGVLLAHDIRNPEAFYEGDRADKRANKVRVFLDIPDLRKVSSPTWSSIPALPFDGNIPKDLTVTEKLLNLGPPGDYLFHALPYAIGGPVAVILVQLVLGLVAVVCVFQLARLLGLSEVYASLGTALYILLPSSLFQPHVLVSEGLFNPLVAIAVYLLVRTVQVSFRWPAFLVAIALLAVAMEIRTQLVLYPFVLVAIFLYYFRRNWARFVVPTLIVCFALPVAWVLFVSSQPNELVIAKTELSARRNLSGIVARMSLRAGFPFERGAYPGEEIPIPEFLGYAIRYPLALVQVKTTDVVELVSNPGITALGKYLGVGLFNFRTETGRLFWSQVKWNAGVVGVVRELLRQDLAFLIPFLAACVVWSVLALGASFGAWLLIKDRRVGGAAKAVLFSIVTYNFAIVQVGEVTRVTQRSPYEFVIAILFTIAAQHLLQRRSALATARIRPPAGGSSPAD